MQNLRMALRHYAFRVFWCALVLLHLPPLIRVSAALTVRYADPAAWLGAGALVLTTLFFILKLCDVAFLRFRATRESALAFILATVLMHQNVTHTVLVSLTEPPAAATLAGCLAGAAVIRSRRIRQFLKWLTATGRSSFRNLPFLHSLLEPVPSNQVVRIRVRSGPCRAPPACRR